MSIKLRLILLLFFFFLVTAVVGLLAQAGHLEGVGENPQVGRDAVEPGYLGDVLAELNLTGLLILKLDFINSLFDVLPQFQMLFVADLLECVFSK